MEHGEAPSVGVVAFEQSGLVLDSCAAGKHQADAVFLEQIEDYDVALVFLGIGRLHSSGVKKGRSIPLDLFADVFVRGQDDFT